MAKIFVVEDSVEMGALIKTVLEADGHAVTYFADSAEALSVIAKETPDLMVLDVMMPKIDGYTFCTALQEDGRFRSLPVIVVTAKGKTREAFKAFPNVVTCLEKPFKNIVLTGMVERALTRNP